MRVRVVIPLGVLLAVSPLPSGAGASVPPPEGTYWDAAGFTADAVEYDSRQWNPSSQVANPTRPVESGLESLILLSPEEVREIPATNAAYFSLRRCAEPGRRGGAADVTGGATRREAMCCRATATDVPSGRT